MESDSQSVANQSMPSLDLQAENGFFDESVQPDAHCILCRRTFELETETIEGIEAIFICRDCKLAVLDDLNTDVTTRESTRRTQRQRRSVSSESIEVIENMFSQQFAELIGLVRHNHETRQHAGYNSNQNRPRRWQRPFSDNGSENLERVDSLFSENGSTISFGNGGESDASVDDHSFPDRDFFVQRDVESHISSDTDIDPMHAVVWNSDDLDDNDDDDDGGEWEETDADEETSGQVREMLYATTSSMISSERNSQNDGWLLWTMHNQGSLHYPNPFNDMEEPELSRNTGNSGDLDAQRFEALVEQLTETESSRRGAPPAAASFVGSLPRVTISKVHEKNGSLICAVCKDSLPVGTETNLLPCLHFYHPCCILPWLRTRNSCPVCRYEVPTDDPDYEAGKRIMGSGRELYEVQEQNIAEESLPSIPAGAGRQGRQHMDAESGEDNSNRHRRGGRWTCLAPIVSIVGMVLVLWLGGPLAEGRSHHRFQQRDSQELAGSSSGTQVSQDNRDRRWFFIF